MNHKQNQLFTPANSYQELLNLSNQTAIIPEYPTPELESQFQEILNNRNAHLLIGVDEVGRGCLFGPVVASAVVLGSVDISGAKSLLEVAAKNRLSQVENLAYQTASPWKDSLDLYLPLEHNDVITYVTKNQDSKQISAKKRGLFASLWQDNPHLIQATIEVGVGHIDKFNILEAAMRAMRLAIYQVLADLEKRCHLAGLDIQELLTSQRIICLIDGNKIPRGLPPELATINVIKGDARVKEISVASILAKVYRDTLVEDLATRPEYEVYKLASHKGYATAEHQRLIREYGYTDQHRKSFAPIKDMLVQEGKTIADCYPDYDLYVL